MWRNINIIFKTYNFCLAFQFDKYLTKYMEKRNLTLCSALSIVWQTLQQWISICIDWFETSNVNIRVDEHGKNICNPKLVCTLSNPLSLEVRRECLWYARWKAGENDHGLLRCHYSIQMKGLQNKNRKWTLIYSQVTSALPCYDCWISKEIQQS